jgi:hypothetical protein
MVKAFTLFVALGLGFLVAATACSPGSSSGIHAPHAIGSDVESGRLAVGVRRLTNREFRKAASALLEFDVGSSFESSLPPDVRQEDGYARNVEQTMSGALAVKLEQFVPGLAREALARRESTFACDGPRSGACIRSWINDLAARAWRRPVQAAEVASLAQVYHQARANAGGDPSEGAVAVLTALLLSPNLWYVRELGELTVTPTAAWRRALESDAVVALTPYEVADQIAIVMRGTLADAPLLSDARAGKLTDASVRQGHARRLLARSDTREHYREFVSSWLEVDKLEQTSKSDTVFEQYEPFKRRMLDETENFVDAVFVSEGASIGSLLGAGFVSVDPAMAVFYGLDAFGSRVDSVSVGRFGVLQQASFLASHSHSDTTSPVLRGDFVLRKVLCHRLPRPGELDIEVTMPRPRRDMTRREQFALHGADPRCAECHDQIDGFGLVFEEFDAAGQRRERELGEPVRTDGKVRYEGEGHSFADSRGLVRWLQNRRETSECFARQLFRFVTGRVDRGAEEAFLGLRDELDDDHRDNVLEHLVAYVGSELFMERRRR